MGCFVVFFVYDGSNVVGYGVVVFSSVNNGVVSYGVSGFMYFGNCSGISSISSVFRVVSYEVSGFMCFSGVDSVIINDYC